MDDGRLLGAEALPRIRGLVRYALAAIVLVYLALATTYSLVTPLGEGPDEPGHAKYVFFLAREQRLPVQCPPPCKGDVPGEGHQPPLAYALAAPALLWLPREERDFDLPGNRRFIWSGGTDTNAVAHGSREHWPWEGAVLAWHLARLVNVVIGGITVGLVFLAGRLISERAGLLSALLVALNPQFLFTSGLLTNDALVTMLSALVLWLVVGGARSQEPGARSQESGRRRGKESIRWSLVSGRALAIGLVLGLALITKQSALILLPVALGWCILSRGRMAGAWGKADWRDRSVWALVRCLSMLVATGIVAGWWYVRNTRLYGDPLGLAVFQAEFLTQAFEPARIDAWLSGLALLHESFWARFGWMNVPVPGWAIAAYTTIEIIALVGLIRAAGQRRRGDGETGRWGDGEMVSGRWSVGMDRDPTVQAAGLWPLFAIPALALAWLVSFALTAGLVAWQGRLLFPALPAVAVLLGTGLAHWIPRRSRFVEVGFAALLALFVVLAAWMPFGVIRPAYPFQTLPAPEAVRRIATPVYARFAARADERGAALRSVRVDGVARPGETLTVTLLWNALGRQNRAWLVFIHLVDDQEVIVAEDNREPRDGMFRMTQWVAGDWIEDPHPLALPADLKPGVYRLRVGLWYPPTSGRAGRFSAGERLLGDYFDAGIVTVTR